MRIRGWRNDWRNEWHVTLEQVCRTTLCGYEWFWIPSEKLKKEVWSCYFMISTILVDFAGGTILCRGERAFLHGNFCQDCSERQWALLWNWQVLSAILVKYICLQQGSDIGVKSVVFKLTPTNWFVMNIGCSLPIFYFSLSVLASFSWWSAHSGICLFHWQRGSYRRLNQHNSLQGWFCLIELQIASLLPRTPVAARAAI